jgi:hypothetical protein
MTANTTIRVSALAGYPDCPRRAATRLFRHEIKDAGFQLRYLPRGIGALVGSAIHYAASAVLVAKAKTGILPTRAVAIEQGREALRDGTEGVELQYDAVTHNMPEAISQTTRMSGIYADVVAPTVNPIIADNERLEAEVEQGLVLSGQPDLVCREPWMIRDLKTGVRMPSSFSPQLGGYSLLARSHGYKIEGAAVDFVRRVAVTKPQPVPVTNEAVIAHAETAASAILRQIASDINVFRNGDDTRRIRPGDPWAFMANPASMLCSAKWCSAYGDKGPHSFCHEWKERD